jgi:hypothetical protein
MDASSLRLLPYPCLNLSKSSVDSTRPARSIDEQGLGRLSAGQYPLLDHLCHGARGKVIGYPILWQLPHLFMARAGLGYLRKTASVCGELRAMVGLLTIDK